MRYALKKTINSSQQRWLEQYGDQIWDWLCDNTTKRFTIPQIADECTAIEHFAPRTRTDIARIIIANVEAEYEDRPDECPFTRRGNTYFWRTGPQ